jgi:hypothetical protein
MQKTKSRVSIMPYVLVAAIIASIAAIGASNWLSEDKRPERSVTISVVWGDGTQVAGGATISWHTTSGGNTTVQVAGRKQPKTGTDTGTESFVEVILARQGDRVILQGSPYNHLVPVGTTITINNVPHAGGAKVEVVVP